MRRPEDPREVLPYIAMSYLYKKSNITHTVWSPLVEITRQRHL